MGKTKNAILDMVDWARAGRSVLVTGKPGSGKTSVSVNEFMAAMAEHLSVGVEEMSLTDLRPCTMDPSTTGATRSLIQRPRQPHG